VLGLDLLLQHFPLSIFYPKENISFQETRSSTFLRGSGMMRCGAGEISLHHDVSISYYNFNFISLPTDFHWKIAIVSIWPSLHNAVSGLIYDTNLI